MCHGLATLLFGLNHLPFLAVIVKRRRIFHKVFLSVETAHTLSSGKTLFRCLPTEETEILRDCE